MTQQYPPQQYPPQQPPAAFQPPQAYPPQQYPPQQPAQQQQQQGGGWAAPPPPPPMANLTVHVGELIALRFHGFEADAMLPWGIKDAVDVEWEVLTGPNLGEHERLQVSNVILVRQLKDQPVGKQFFGRVGAQPGRQASPAIFLDAPRTGDEQFINAYLARQGGGQAAPQQQPQQPPPNYPPQQQYAPQGPPQGQQSGSNWNPPASPQAGPAPTQQNNYDPPPF